VLDADYAARIAGYHVTALELMAANPDTEHRVQSLLSAEELHFNSRRSPDRRESYRIAGFTSCSRRRWRLTLAP
jgi:hypothetical protein